MKESIYILQEIREIESEILRCELCDYDISSLLYDLDLLKEKYNDLKKKDK